MNQLSIILEGQRCVVRRADATRYEQPQTFVANHQERRDQQSCDDSNRRQDEAAAAPRAHTVPISFSEQRNDLRLEAFDRIV